VDLLRSRTAQDASFITFGEFQIECGARRLIRAGRRQHIQARPLDVLIYLAVHHERIVSRDELLERFWSREVNEETLTRCISTLRKILGDAREPPRFIETLWGRGYRFIAPVSITTDAQVSVSQAPSLPSRRATPRRLAWILSGVAALAALAAVLLRPVTEDPRHLPVERLAVLPMTPSVESDEWLAIALTDHLTQLVARIEGVTVITVTSREWLAPRSEVRELGRLLGAGAVLYSHLVRDGERFGLRARLVATADGSVLWNFSIPPGTGPMEPAQVEQLATEVARRMWANLQLRSSRQAVTAEAYQQYLRGRYFWSQRSSVSLSAAIDAFESALAIEPDYVDALLGMADSWLLMPLYAATPPGEAMQRARAAAQRAMELDHQAAHALAVLGVIAMQYDWRWTDAEADLRRSLELNPNDPTAVQWLGELFCYTRRFEECQRHYELAAGLDPLAPVLHMLQGSPALHSGDYAGAVRAYSQAVSAAPGFPFARYVLGLAHAGLANWEQASAEYRAVLSDLGLAIVGGPLVFALARGGNVEAAREVLADLEALAQQRYVPPTKFATAWLGLGEQELALRWLKQARELRDDRLIYLAVDVHFRELHGDPGFRAIARDVGLLDILPPAFQAPH
jgi:DNA-binding winged helix-turn-helix (wHTH) protein/tetratricopeptide (TPR) repeat protein/TolB-like protein